MDAWATLMSAHVRNVSHGAQDQTSNEFVQLLLGLYDFEFISLLDRLAYGSAIHRGVIFN